MARSFGGKHRLLTLRLGKHDALDHPPRHRRDGAGLELRRRRGAAGARHPCLPVLEELHGLPGCRSGHQGLVSLVPRGRGRRGVEAARALAQRRPGLLEPRRHVYGTRALRARRGGRRHAQPLFVEHGRERALHRAARGRRLLVPERDDRRRDDGVGHLRGARRLLRGAPGARGPRLLRGGRELRRPLRAEHGRGRRGGQRCAGGRRGAHQLEGLHGWKRLGACFAPNCCGGT